MLSAGTMKSHISAALLVLTVFFTASTARAQATPAYAELMDLEAQFEAAHLEHELNSGSADDLVGTLNELLAPVSEEEVLAFKEGRLSDVSPFSLTRLEQASQRIEIWSQGQEEVQAAYDALSQAKSNYFIDHAFNYIYLAMGDVNERLGGTPAASRLAALYQTVWTDYSLYVLNRDEYGKGKDFKRLTAYKAFFSHAAEFTEALNEAYSGNSTGPSLWQQITRYGNLATRFAAYGLPTFLRAAGAWVMPFFPAYFENAYRYTNRFFMRLARVLGHTVEIKMPYGPIPKNNARTLNVFTPNHSDLMLDLMTAGTTIGTMAPDAYAFSARHAQPGFFRPFIAKNHAIVSVGAGEKPVDAILERLRTDTRRSILIYPEGSLPLGMGETRPVREKFSSEFIDRLRGVRDAGFRVNIIPLTSTDSYRFINAHRFFGPNEPGQQNLELQVHRTLDTKVVDMLLMSELAMNRVIRGMWLQTLPTSDTRLAGTFRVTEVFRRIREFVANRLPGGGPSACRTYLENLDADVASASSRNTIPVPALSR